MSILLYSKSRKKAIMLIANSHSGLYKLNSKKHVLYKRPFYISVVIFSFSGTLPTLSSFSPLKIDISEV